MDLAINIIFENEFWLVVDKPCSIPVHPCGNFKYNSLIWLLKLQLKDNIKPVNRLDWQTSGIVVFAKSEKNISQPTKKVYFARVKDNF